MTVAMALAESTHHSSRGQKIARAGVWGREMNYTATIRAPIPEHAIFKVPKISCPSRFPRSALREPQKAEQLVEAPTLVWR